MSKIQRIYKQYDHHDTTFPSVVKDTYWPVQWNGEERMYVTGILGNVTHGICLRTIANSIRTITLEGSDEQDFGILFYPSSVDFIGQDYYKINNGHPVHKGDIISFTYNDNVYENWKVGSWYEVHGTDSDILLVEQKINDIFPSGVIYGKDFQLKIDDFTVTKVKRKKRRATRAKNASSEGFKF
jgi:hypothetical protein